METQGSASVLNHAAFTDPRAYTLNVKRPGSEERTTKTVDLLETFNYLLGLRVQHKAAPEAYTAAFERVQEKDVPKDSPQRLVVKGNLKPDENASGGSARCRAGCPATATSPTASGTRCSSFGAPSPATWNRTTRCWTPTSPRTGWEIRDREYDATT
ncbi:MAG: hypothetical protein R2818_12980 [Flavobacteriales bacterium]